MNDLVDELPRERSVIASLTYAGNIATLEGLKILIKAGYVKVVEKVIEFLNLNHFYQTKITSTLWASPQDEKGYLTAISHTKYWVAIGLEAATAFSGKSNLEPFVREFSECYGTTCQLFDDMREIRDDLENGYWSLPISIAKSRGWDLNYPPNLNLAIQQSRQLALGYLGRAKERCGNNFPRLKELVERIEKAGLAIGY